MMQASTRSARHPNRLVLAGFLLLMLLIAALSRIILAPFTFLENPSRRQKHLTLVDRYWRLVLALPSM